MTQSNNPPTLTQANHIYLYRLLAGSIGCGRQTFITHVEEVLASDRMTAEDLGFESTRDLLEELDEFVTLTVFKGGRIYATIVAQPEWDEALEQQAKTDSEGAQAGARARRRGRTKTVRAVKPRRVRREEETGDAADPAEAAQQEETTRATGTVGTATAVPARAEMTAPTATNEGSASTTESPTTPHAAEQDVTPPVGDISSDASNPETRTTLGTETPETEGAPAKETDGEREACEPEADGAAESPDEPSISFTVTYDPYAGKETGKADAAATVPEPAPEIGTTSRSQRPDRRPTGPAVADEPWRPASEPTAASPDTPPSPEALASYPEEFASEVYLPQALDGVLAAALPYGESAMDALAQGYGSAKDVNGFRGNRTQARFSFDLPESALSCTACIRRRTGGGFAWSVCSVELVLK